MRFIYIMLLIFTLYKNPDSFNDVVSFCIVMFLFDISCEVHNIKYLLKKDKEQC